MVVHRRFWWHKAHLDAQRCNGRQVLWLLLVCREFFSWFLGRTFCGSFFFVSNRQVIAFEFGKQFFVRSSVAQLLRDYRERKRMMIVGRRWNVRGLHHFPHAVFFSDFDGVLSLGRITAQDIGRI